MFIDLLSRPAARRPLWPAVWTNAHSWRVDSGTWKPLAAGSVIYLPESRPGCGENMSLIGSRRWSGYRLQVVFKLLTESLRPPDGGAVIYFHVRGGRDFYSFHFGLVKQRVEFVKRRRGAWSIGRGAECPLARARDYLVDITSRGENHECRVDGVPVLAVRDRDLSSGCIGIGVKHCEVEFSRVLLAPGDNGTDA